VKLYQNVGLESWIWLTLETKKNDIRMTVGQRYLKLVCFHHWANAHRFFPIKPFNAVVTKWVAWSGQNRYAKICQPVPVSSKCKYLSAHTTSLLPGPTLHSIFLFSIDVFFSTDCSVRRLDSCSCSQLLSSVRSPSDSHQRTASWREHSSILQCSITNNVELGTGVGYCGVRQWIRRFVPVTFHPV